VKTAAANHYECVRYGDKIYMVGLNGNLYTLTLSGGVWSLTSTDLLPTSSDQAPNPTLNLYGIGVKGDGTNAKYAWISHRAKPGSISGWFSKMSFWDLTPYTGTPSSLSGINRNGYPVYATAVVTAQGAAGVDFWVENQERTIGARVAWTGAMPAVGNLVTLSAVLSKTTSGEKLLTPITGGVVEGAAADGKGHIFVNNEGKNTIQVIDVKTWKATASWPLAPCEGPTGIAYDKASNRIFSGCNNTSVVVDPDNGKIVATIKNGTRVDALGWDPSKKLIYIPNGGEGNVTVVHQDSPDKYTTVATVDTFRGAKTIAVDPVTHNAYLFQPERGPAPAPPAGAAPPATGGRGRGPQGPIIAAWFIVIKQ